MLSYHREIELQGVSESQTDRQTEFSSLDYVYILQRGKK